MPGPPKRIPAVCEHCSQPFMAIAKDVRKGWGRFCTRLCQTDWQRSKSVELFVQRFWGRVLKTESCWLWQGGKHTGFGYGVCWTPIGLNGKRTLRLAHRVAWELTHGPIPSKLEVCHKCDNPPCVNPAHLFIGTHADNMRDGIRKGRIVPPPKDGGWPQRRAARLRSATQVTDQGIAR